MASASLLPPTQFLGSNPKSAVQSPATVKFRQAPRISASCATATVERTAASSSSLYEVLGIQAGASGQEIKSAYRRLARVVHPDVGGGRTANGGSAADEFMRIHAAYSTLSDPEKRAHYDSSLFRGFSGRPTSSSSGLGRPRRNWETDQCW